MTPWPALILFVIVATAAADDLVNERLTASAAAREVHWGVNCSATLLALRGVTGSSAAVEEALTKCRFIHQPPGAADAENCPDFRAILAAYQSHDAEALRHALQNSEPCLNAQPTDDRNHD